MARIVRKLSTKATQGQKKNSSFIKKLIITISSAVVVIGVTLTIILIVVNNNNNSSTDSVTNYFGKAYTEKMNSDYDISDSGQAYEIKFKKESWYGIKNYANTDYKDLLNQKDLHINNIFVFAYDSKNFDAEKAGSTEATLVARLASLQYFIEQNHLNTNADNSFALYIVDTAVGDNSKILTDPLFSGNENNTSTCLFAYIKDGEYMEKLNEDVDKDYISQLSLDTICSTSVRLAKQLVMEEINK